MWALSPCARCVFYCVLRGRVKLFHMRWSWYLSFNMLLSARKKECNSKVKLSELIVKCCYWSATGWPSVCRSVLLKLFLFFIFFTILCHQSLQFLPELLDSTGQDWEQKNSICFQPTPSREYLHPFRIFPTKSWNYHYPAPIGHSWDST